jgi:hypothetical protein
MRWHTCTQASAWGPCGKLYLSCLDSYILLIWHSAQDPPSASLIGAARSEGASCGSLRSSHRSYSRVPWRLQLLRRPKRRTPVRRASSLRHPHPPGISAFLICQPLRWQPRWLSCVDWTERLCETGTMWKSVQFLPMAPTVLCAHTLDALLGHTGAHVDLIGRSRPHVCVHNRLTLRQDAAVSRAFGLNLGGDT